MPCWPRCKSHLVQQLLCLFKGKWDGRRMTKSGRMRKVKQQNMRHQRFLNAEIKTMKSEWEVSSGRQAEATPGWVRLRLSRPPGSRSGGTEREEGLNERLTSSEMAKQALKKKSNTQLPWHLNRKTSKVTDQENFNKIQTIIRKKKEKKCDVFTLHCDVYHSWFMLGQSELH